MGNMKLFQAIIVLISLVLVNTALADAHTSSDTQGIIGDMPSPEWLGTDLKYSMPAYLFMQTQFMRFETQQRREEDA